MALALVTSRKKASILPAGRKAINILPHAPPPLILNFFMVRSVIMGKFTKEKNKHCESVNHDVCIAKTTFDGSPGLSVYEHCLYAGKIAAHILKFFPGSMPAFIHAVI